MSLRRWYTGAYASIRRQFKLPIGKSEGNVEEASWRRIGGKMPTF